MKKNKHTPGPWVCHSGMVWTGVTEHDAREYPIARMDRDTPHTSPTDRDANARLIAAAPDMLEALERIISEMDAIKDPSFRALADAGCIRLGREAIQKATQD